MANLWKNTFEEIRKEAYNLGEQHGIELGLKIGEQRGIEIGEQRGVEIGIQIGEQRGIKIGEQRGKLTLVESMLDAGTIDDEHHSGIPRDIYDEVKKRMTEGEEVNSV